MSGRPAAPPGAAVFALVALAAAGPAPTMAAEIAPAEAYALLQEVISPERKERKAAAARLAEAGDATLVPALVDAYFFTPAPRRAEIRKALAALTGERFERYHDWVEYVGGREDLTPKEGYLEWKLALLQRIDVDYGRILYPGAPARIRLEEVVWGGVPVAGIPALDDPPVIPADEARYLRPGERVFGVLLGGEARAYPLRILDWHEMLNDTVGGEPVTLSYCTLCGSGILFSTRTPSGEARRFDTSGLLYRSNKLMVDRQSYTLWSNLTGIPVVGRLARAEIELPVLAMTLTTWEEWRRRHPETRVLDLEGVERSLGGKYRFDYRPGAADRARTGVSFPVWLKNDVLERDAEVFALRVGGRAKAYPLDALAAARVVNDELGGESLVLVADPASGAVRAYRRGDRVFRPGDGPLQIVDQDGGRWRVGEQRLEPLAGEGEPLARLPGHVALWFGWFGFHPQTEVFGIESTARP